MADVAKAAGVEWGKLSASEKSVWEKKVSLEIPPLIFNVPKILRQPRTRRDTKGKWKSIGPARANEEAALASHGWRGCLCEWAHGAAGI